MGYVGLYFAHISGPIHSELEHGYEPPHLTSNNFGLKMMTRLLHKLQSFCYEPQNKRAAQQQVTSAQFSIFKGSNV